VLIKALPEVATRFQNPEFLDESESTLLRWYIRYLSQLLARNMNNYEGQAKDLWRLAAHPGSHPAPNLPNYGLYRIMYTYAYLSFAILELRIQGKLPAWEGILLVKERRKE
jgi:hypothetical protein